MEQAEDTARVRLDRLRRDPGYQVRAKLDCANVERLRRAYGSGRAVNPISIALVEGQDVPVLVDGWHRVDAMLSLGIFEADALVFRTNERGARWLAASANLNHGLPLKRRELRTVFAAFIKARRHRKKGGGCMSYREIAPEIGVSHETIRKWMMKDFPKIAAENGGNDEFHGRGGLVEEDGPEGTLDGPEGTQDAPEGTSEAAARATIEAAFGTIREAFKGLTDAATRGQAIELGERVLEDMRAAGEWRASDF